MFRCSGVPVFLVLVHAQFFPFCDYAIFVIRVRMRFSLIATSFLDIFSFLLLVSSIMLLMRFRINNHELKITLMAP